MGKLRIVKMYGEVDKSPSGDSLFPGNPPPKLTVQRKAFNFEKRILRMLDNMKFENIDGGPLFTPGGFQVDACGGYEDKLLVIDCTMTDKKKKTSLRAKIVETRGKAKAILKGLRTEIPYKEKYEKFLTENKNILFVIATNNIIISDVDREEARKGQPMIYIWDEQFLDHYFNLAQTIGPYAKYHLFGELGLKPAITDQIKVPAFRIEWGGRGYYYNFLIEPQRLLKYAFVARREIGREKYYQRILKSDRIKNQIRKFLETKSGFFPNNIIISINEIVEFEKLSNLESYDFWPKWLDFGVLTFPGNYRSCWIIDGQHRLFSFMPEMDKQISVAAFTDLPEAQQAQFFVDINKEQKAVSKDLIWDLEEWLRPTSEEGIISTTVKLLNKAGIFKDKIQIPLLGRGRNKIKFTSFCDAIKYRELVREYTEKGGEGFKNPYHSPDYLKTSEKLSSSLNLYFTIINEVFSDEAKSYLLDTGGITVMIIILERILSALKKTLTKEDICNYMQMLRDAWKAEDKSFYKELATRTTSEGSKNIIAKDILRIFSRQDSRFLRYLLEETPIEKTIAQFENELREFVNNSFSAISQNWVEKFVPAQILTSLKIKRGKKNEPIYSFLSLGELEDIIIIRENWEKVFRDIFVGEEFANKELFQGTMLFLVDIRNRAQHGKGISFGEEEKVRFFIKQLKMCLNIE